MVCHDEDHGPRPWGWSPSTDKRVTGVSADSEDDNERLGDASRLVRCLPAGLVNQPTVRTGTLMRPASAA
jgi:hypothetical protein